MGESAQLWLFFLVVFGVIALPGMDMAFVLASSVTGGRPAGAAAIAGIVAGGVCHVVMGALGVAAILAVLPALFNAMLIAGALYIGWIGWSLLRTGSAITLPEHRSRRRGSVFVQGMLTCLLNPKAYVFMLAIFPQFLRPGEGAIWLQASAFGLITAGTQAGVYGAVALMSFRAREWLSAGGKGSLLATRSVGALLIGAAIVTAVQGWQTGS